MMRTSTVFGKGMLPQLYQALDSIVNRAWNSLQPMPPSSAAQLPSLVREMQASCAPSQNCDSRFHARLTFPVQYSSAAVCCQQKSEASSASAYLISVSTEYRADRCSRIRSSGLLPSCCSSGCSVGATRLVSTRARSTTCLPGAHKQHAAIGSIASSRWSETRLLRSQQSLGELQCGRSIHASSLQADSVLRKRRSKMKRHKWKKRQRLMRRKSKVSQGAKR